MNSSEDKSDVKQTEPTILVIEDSRDDQEMLIRQLKKSGVNERVVCVNDGTDALALVRAGSQKLSAVCAVFLDLSLPGVDGLLLLKAIRANVETSLMPVFVMTGSTNPNNEVASRRLGATRFIPKQLLSLPSFRSTLSELFSSTKMAGQTDRPSTSA